MIRVDGDRLVVSGPAGVRGSLAAPGDKSLSHRALICAALADGESTITNLAPGDDVAATADALVALGIRIDGYTVQGGTWAEPLDVLDFRNSGTGLRTFLGVCAGLPFVSFLTGDTALRSRPMLPVVDPLRQMGADVHGRLRGDSAPLSVKGGRLRPIRHETKFARTHVKSALLFAGLAADGVTEVVQPATRDHTERMLAALGVEVAGTSVRGPARPAPLGQYHVPGDISSAAFPLCAAALMPGSRVTIEGVGVNPTRTGLLDVLTEMGVAVSFANQQEVLGEPLADVTVEGPERLRAVEVTGALVPRLVDEVPVLAVLMARAHGLSVVRDAEELRIKESDRVSTVVDGLAALGVQSEVCPDGLVVRGPQEIRPGTVASHGDHRIAMAFAVAALAAEGETTIEGQHCIAVSYPAFAADLQGLLF